MDKSSIGRKVKTLRDARKWSQEDLASVAGVHRNTVSNIETGHDVMLSNLDAIAGALGVDVSTLTAPDIAPGNAPASVQPSGA